MARSTIRSILGRFLRNERGSSDMTVALLLTAAGAAMVGLTVPSLFRSSDTAARTFDHQVKVLERGATGGPAAAPGIGGLPAYTPSPSVPIPPFELADPKTPPAALTSKAP